MVGSSFTADFQLAELLAGRLGQVVWDGGAAGTAFGESLSRFVTGFHGKALPKTVLYEFPVHQTFGLAQDFASTNGSLGGFFATASGLATQPLPARMGVELTVPPPPGRKQHVPRGFFAPGMLLSSGDGVLQLVASFHSPKPTSWSVRSQDHTLDFTVGAGPQRIVVPVLQPNQAGQLVALVGIDPAAVEVDVAITLELDADLASAAPVALAREGATWRSAALERDVPHDQLAVFEWSEGRASSVTVSIQGRTAEGAPLVIERTFAQPRARVAVLGIGGLAGGSVDGATIAFDANTTIESATLVLTERFAP